MHVLYVCIETVFELNEIRRIRFIVVAFKAHYWLVFWYWKCNRAHQTDRGGSAILYPPARYCAIMLVYLLYDMLYNGMVVWCVGIFNWNSRVYTYVCMCIIIMRAFRVVIVIICSQSVVLTCFMIVLIFRCGMNLLSYYCFIDSIHMYVHVSVCACVCVCVWISLCICIIFKTWGIPQI